MKLNKASPDDFKGRFREIINDPINLLIRRVPNAGYVLDNHVVMHNGLHMPISGEHAYYHGFSDILVINRGVHEPLEEFCFQTLLKRLAKQQPTMLELGAYWAHYSSWLKHIIPESTVIMVEPEEQNILSGKYTFEKNMLQGEFINDFVGQDAFQVDRYLQNKNLNYLDVLHSDIQGYELEMLEGAKQSLINGRVGYLMISTHSESLHDEVTAFLERVNYRVEISSGFDMHTTSFDGFIFASNQNLTPVFSHFTPLGRNELIQLNPFQLLNYISQLKIMV